jgi:hypothetical protein
LTLFPQIRTDLPVGLICHMRVARLRLRGGRPQLAFSDTCFEQSRWEFRDKEA